MGSYYILKDLQGNYSVSKSTGADSSVTVTDEVSEDIFETLSKCPNSYFIDELGKFNQLMSVEDAKKHEIRAEREKECFPVINRGELWYAKLTEVQKVELSVWYEAWLNAPQTGTVPVKPEWVK